MTGLSEEVNGRLRLDERNEALSDGNDDMAKLVFFGLNQSLGAYFCNSDDV